MLFQNFIPTKDVKESRSKIYLDKKNIFEKMILVLVGLLAVIAAGAYLNNKKVIVDHQKSNKIQIDLKTFKIFKN